MLTDVAEPLDITDLQLSFLLNHYMKINFNSWINNLRIEEAKRIIKENPQMSISEVAYASGFSDANIFIRNFRKTVGVAPDTYKNAL